MSTPPKRNPDLRRKTIIQQAERLLRDERLDSLPVDLNTLAASRGIVVQAKPDTTEGVSGMLLRHGDAFGILYGTHLKNPGFERFSIAHELGHYFLEGHPEHLLPGDGSVHESRAGFASDDPYEREADYFASGLLMPSGPFERELRRLDDGLDAVLALAERCGTSRTATAIRYASLTRGGVGVIVSRGETVEFAFLSEAMKSLKDIAWPRKGSALPRDSLTARFNAAPARVRAAERDQVDTDLAGWLGGRSALGLEEVLGLGRYGRTLTVLTCSSAEDDTADEEGDGEDAMIESWTPTFRR